jgi:hypothetical protein
MKDILLHLGSVQHFFITHTIDPTDFLHPFPASHFKTFQVLPVYALECPRLSTTLT